MKKNIFRCLMVFLFASALIFMAGCEIVIREEGDQLGDCVVGEWVEEIPATCTEAGVKGHYECVDCGQWFTENYKKIEVKEIPALGHSYGNLVKGSPANCAHGGTADHYECSRCGKLFDSNKQEIETLETPATEHTYKWVEEVASTCKSKGLAGHYECTKCFKYFNSNHEEVTKKELELELAEHQYAEIDDDDYFRYSVCSVCGKGIRKEAEGNLDQDLYIDWDQDAYDQLIIDVDNVMDMCYDKTATLQDLVDVYEDMCDLSWDLMDYYYYVNYRYARINDADAIAAYEEVNQMYNEFVDKYDKFRVAAYDSELKDQFLTTEYFDQEELDEIEEMIELLRDTEIKGLNDQIDAIETYLKNTEITTYQIQQEFLHQYYTQVQLRNQLAQKYGYDNYYDMGLLNYGRVYTADDVDIMRDYYNEYLAALLDELSDEYDTFAQNYHPSASEGLLYDAIYNSTFENPKTLNFIADYYSIVCDEESGLSFFDNINQAFKDDAIVFGSKYEGAYCQHGSKVPYMYFQNKVGYGDAFTFVHESGHYNLSCDPALDDFDLYETHSQANEQLFARYIINYCNEKGYAKLAKFVVLKLISDWNWTLSINTIADEFEQRMYENYYDGLSYDGQDIFRDGIAENEMAALWNTICAKYGFAYGGYFTTIISYYYSKNSVYELAYVMSLIPSIGVFAMSDEQGIDVAIEHYLKTYLYAFDENFTAEETYVNILEYAGLYSPFEEDTYIAIKECLEKLLD